MKFNNLAEQTKALFSGTVLLGEYYSNIEVYEEEALSFGVDSDFINMEYPYQVYAVELRTDYDLNAKEYEAAGVFYSDKLGAYVWPVFTFGTSWELTSPQNIHVDYQD